MAGTAILSLTISSFYFERKHACQTHQMVVCNIYIFGHCYLYTDVEVMLLLVVAWVYRSTGDESIFRYICRDS